jgi:hypothetical protein
MACHHLHPRLAETVRAGHWPSVRAPYRRSGRVGTVVASVRGPAVRTFHSIHLPQTPPRRWEGGGEKFCLWLAPSSKTAPPRGIKGSLRDCPSMWKSYGSGEAGSRRADGELCEPRRLTRRRTGGGEAAGEDRGDRTRTFADASPCQQADTVSIRRLKANPEARG